MKDKIIYTLAILLVIYITFTTYDQFLLYIFDLESPNDLNPMRIFLLPAYGMIVSIPAGIIVALVKTITGEDNS